MAHPDSHLGDEKISVPPGLVTDVGQLVGVDPQQPFRPEPRDQAPSFYPEAKLALHGAAGGP